MIYPKDVKSLTMSLRTIHPYGDNIPVSLCTMSKTSHGCNVPKLYVPYSWPGRPRIFFYDGSQCPSFFRYCMTAEDMLSVGNRDVWWKNQRLTLYRCSKSCSDSAENISIASLIPDSKYRQLRRCQWHQQCMHCRCRWHRWCTSRTFGSSPMHLK